MIVMSAKVCMRGWMDGWMDGRRDGWMDGWMPYTLSVNQNKHTFLAVCLDMCIYTDIRTYETHVGI